MGLARRRHIGTRGNALLDLPEERHGVNDGFKDQKPDAGHEHLDDRNLAVNAKVNDAAVLPKQHRNHLWVLRRDGARVSVQCGGEGFPRQ